MAASEEIPVAGEEGASRPSFARSAASTFLTNVAVAILSFASVLITARSLGATGRGDVALLTTIAFLSSELASLGVQQSDANFAAQRPERSPQLAATSTVIAGVAGLATMGILGALFALYPAASGHAHTGILIVVVLVVPVLLLQLYLQQLVLAQYDFRLNNVAWLVAPVVNVATNGILALLGHLSVETAVGSWVAGQVLTTLLFLGAILRQHGGFGRPDWATAKSLLAFGVKAHLGRIMLVGNFRIDQWLLGIIAGTHQLGLYSVAVAWSEALFFLPTAIQVVQRPDLARDTLAAARERTETVFRWTVMATMALAVGMVLLAPVLCVTFFGEDFRDSVGMLRVLALGAFGIAALKLLGNALTAQGKPMLETGAIGVAFFAMVTLDLALMPGHGGMGASVASTAAYTCGGLAAVVIFRRGLGGRLRGLVPTPGDAVTFTRQARAQLGR